MRATVLNGPGDVSVETVDEPTLPDAASVIVEVTHTAICGSDLHLYHGVHGTPGLHLGHEFVGTVVEAGSQAELAAVPAADTACRVVPEGITPEEAVLLTDILPTGYYGARNAEVSPGDTVAVIGMGPVGVFALQSALVMGAATVLAVDTVPERLAHAEALGAVPIDATQGTVAQLLHHTQGRGVDATIEAVGADQTVTDALYATRPGGIVSVIGANLNMEFPFPLALAFIRDLTFRI